MKKIIKILLLSFIITTALVISASAANLGGGTVTADSLNFRASPSIEATILASASYGDKIVITESVDDEWYQVLYEGVRGYMHAFYIEKSDKLDFSIGEGEIVGNGVRFREAASYESETITFLYLGDNVTVSGVDGEWYKLEYDGKIGYVHSDYVSIFDNPTDEDSPSSYSASVAVSGGSDEGNKLVEFAMAFLGTPYVYGGSSSGGFDCSGFTYYVFNQNGYAITRTASSQWYDGTFVSKDSLEVGDLVFFSSDTSNDIEHVGMYIGNGQFIHSSSGGGCVKLNNMSDFYYNNNYYGAMRVI